MHFQSITVAAAFLSAAAAIPCSDIGWSSGIEGVNPALDPFDPQGRWEVVKAKECWVRFQSYEPGQNPKDVRVTKTEFEATPAQVLGTINNYFGGPGNIMLWLPMKTKSFQYANILPPKINDDFPVVDGQSSIVKGRTVLSIILPSGAKKLEIVQPRATEQDESNINRERAEEMGITGLKGTISSDDWAYSTAAEAQLTLQSIYREQLNAYIERREPNLKNAWVTAEKADSNDCVVIDFRDFEKFILRPRPAARG
ncbi:hypothetical protein NW762_011985 [Fusarium torreyae]|uniref:Uncharacterized protein n=1 Tax=Fusarium torreyae TaxID=1237075 RepID=A0A9W8RQ31_9HYPO|nr:hypothetical protein NW762_011985 [Fusarium torreyae]